MSANVHVRERVAGSVPLFRDRADAGRLLAAFVDPPRDEHACVFALPRGGVPVGRALADVLGCELRLALVRKLPIPTDPEMGFGAVTADGTVRLNRRVVAAYGISERQIRDAVEATRAEVLRRADAYPGSWPPPDLVGRQAWLVDDGLATGLSMLAAVDMLRAHDPASVLLAVPCSPVDSLARAAEVVDEAWCIAEQSGRPFAVASFYRDFHDLSDAEVLAALDR